MSPNLIVNFLSDIAPMFLDSVTKPSFSFPYVWTPQILWSTFLAHKLVDDIFGQAIDVLVNGPCPASSCATVGFCRLRENAKLTESFA